MRQVPGIVRRAEDSVKRLRSCAELRRVGLADDDRARAPDTFDNNIVFRGNVVLIERRAEGSADAAGFQQIFVRDRQTVERPDFLFARLHLIGLCRSLRGHLRHQAYDGIDLRVDAFDLLQVRGQCFPCRQLFRADETCHFHRAGKAKRGNGGFRLRRVCEERRGCQASQCFPARMVVFAHSRELTIALVISYPHAHPSGNHDSGFNPTGVMTGKASLDDARYHDPAAFRKLLDESLSNMRRIPGVRNAAVGLSLPYERALLNGVIFGDGQGTRQAIITKPGLCHAGLLRHLADSAARGPNVH
jgi:hypothetical protein